MDPYSKWKSSQNKKKKNKKQSMSNKLLHVYAMCLSLSHSIILWIFFAMLATLFHFCFSRARVSFLFFFFSFIWIANNMNCQLLLAFIERTELERLLSLFFLASKFKKNYFSEKWIVRDAAFQWHMVFHFHFLDSHCTFPSKCTDVEPTNKIQMHLLVRFFHMLPCLSLRKLFISRFCKQYWCRSNGASNLHLKQLDLILKHNKAIILYWYSWNLFRMMLKYGSIEIIETSFL